MHRVVYIVILLNHCVLYIAVQYPENHYAEEYEKKLESFHLYPAEVDKATLRSIEMIGDEQSEKLKRRIDESLASLHHHLQTRLDDLCNNKQHYVTEILSTHLQQARQLNESQTSSLEEQIRSEIMRLLNEHKCESLRVLERETSALKHELQVAIEKQHAESKRLLTLYNNSQIETKAYLCVIIAILVLFLSLFIYTMFKV